MTWKVIGASAPGTLHQKRGAHCQDAFAFQVLPNGHLIIAVADGAGSARNARQGADLAVSTVMTLLRQSFENDPFPDSMMIREEIKAAFSATRQALVSLAATNEQPLSTYATTLACVVAVGDHLGVGHLGDAVLVAKTRTGRLKLMNEPQRGEFANDSYFITMPEALSYCRFETYSEAVKGLALTTDGLLRLSLKLPDYLPYPEFFKPLFAFAENMDDPMEAEQELKQFLVSGPVNNRTDDDKTLILATCALRG